MAVDYSPTGREFVSGSYDRTIRIFGVNDGHSREVYHTKRMQRYLIFYFLLKSDLFIFYLLLFSCSVFAVKYSLDNKYVLSGSDEFNIRLWKAQASEKLGVVCFYLFICLFAF